MTRAEKVIAAVFGALGGSITAYFILIHPPRVH